MKRPGLIFFLVTAIFFASPVWVLASDYYVSTSGNDSNPGTINQPWQTINRATHNVVAGDTIFVRGGEYPTVQYGFQFLHSGTAAQPITLTNYPGEQVIFRITLTQKNPNPDGVDGYEAFQCWAYRGTSIADFVKVIGTIVQAKTLGNGLSSAKGIVIAGPAGVTNREYGFTSTGCSHWEVAGVDFVDLGYAIWTSHYVNDTSTGALLNPPVISSDWYVHDNRVYNHFRESGMQFNDGHNRIENNQFYKVDDRYDSPYGCQQLNLLNRNNFVHGNIFSSSGSTMACAGLLFEWDLADRNVVDGNKFIDNPSGGIAIAGGDDNLIRNNIIYQKSGGNQFVPGIAIFSYDNTIKTDWPCNETTGSFRFLVPPNDSTHPDYPYFYNPRNCHAMGNQIFNNTIYGYEQGVKIFALPGENTAIKNNVFGNWSRGSICFYESSTGKCKALTSEVSSDHNVDSGTFGFRDVGNFDFNLQAVSPLVDAGFDLGALVPNDFDGSVRPLGTGYDIGAYELSESSAQELKTILGGYLKTATSDLDQYPDYKINALDFVTVLKRLP